MMKTQVKTRKARDLYLKRIRQFPLRPLRSDEELEAAIQVIDSLLDCSRLDPGERDYLDVLSDLVERYESEMHPIPSLSDADMLRHLLEAKQVTQVQLANATGIVESTISALLSGKRSLNRTQIGKLARFFHVEPTVFSFDAA